MKNIRLSSSILPARQLMRKSSFVILLGFFGLAGCGSATFSVASDDSPDASEDQAIAVKKDSSAPEPTDGGLDGFPDALHICDPFSCGPECGGCDSGLKCGNGGVSTCGSTNCSFDYASDAASFSCPSGLAMIYKCYHYPGQNTQDIMPRCLARGGSTADGDYTRWCCPQQQ